MRKPSVFLHRVKVFYLGLRIVLSYTLYNIRANKLKLRFGNEERRLEAIHRKNARMYARFAAGARGALIKLGQLGSARADVVPAVMVEELAGLQDQVQPAPFEEIRATLEGELGKSIPELFARFEEKPLGAASLGQVHEAVLHDQRKVAVKVQYPHIETVLARDFDFLHAILPWIQPLQPKIQFLPLFVEFRHAVEGEIDYRHEAENCRRVGRELGTLQHLRTPGIIDTHSSERVLTMTFVEGHKITEVAQMRALGFEPEVVMKRVVELYAEQIFVNGFFQSDPHPGNLFFDKGPSGELILGLVDFGQAKEVPLTVHTTVLRGVAALLGGDLEACARAMVDLGFMAEKDLARLIQELQKLAVRMGPNLMMGLLSGGSGGESAPDMNTMKKEFQQFLRETDGITMPPDLVLYGRTLTLLQGLTARIAPELRLFPTLFPYLVKAVAKVRKTAE